MWVVFEGGTPRAEHAEEAGDIGSHILGIGGNFSHLHKLLNQMGGILMSRRGELQGDHGDFHYGGEKGAVVKGMNAAEEPGDFIPAQDGRQAMCLLGAQDFKDLPVAGHDLLIEEAEAAIADAHGLGRPARDILTIKKVVRQLRFVQELGGFSVELGQHAHRVGVGLLGALALAVELEGSTAD